MPKGYSLDALANVVYPCARSSLSTEDLNTLSTPDYFGVYGQAANANATPERNYPVALAGTLEVLPQTGGGCTQRYTIYTGGMDFYVRSLHYGTWGNWRRFRPFDQIFSAIFPVGIELSFTSTINPNTEFPGTTWVQIVDGRVMRGATNFVIGTAAGNIGETGGADSVSIAVGNLPVHAHTMAHTHNIRHQHDVRPHAHGMAHTHTMAHTHSTPNHTHSGTANSGGDHSHVIDLDAQGMNSNGPNGYGKITTGSDDTEGTFKKFNTNSGGAHTHAVTIPSSGGGTTGSSSAANTGGSSNSITGDSGQFATMGGPDDSGDSSAANTGNAGSGSSLGIQNLFRRVAIWRRTA